MESRYGGKCIALHAKKKLKASRTETDLYQELPDALSMVAEPTAEYLSSSKAGVASSSIDFFLTTVTIHRLAVQETGHPVQKELDVNIMIEYEATKEQRGISCTVNYTLSATNMHLLDCRVTCLFTIDKADWDTMLKDGRLVIPSAFAKYITILTSGVTRGALESKIMDSGFKSYLMTFIITDDLPDNEITIEI